MPRYFVKSGPVIVPIWDACELLVESLQEAVTAAKQPIVVADDFFRPLPGPCGPPDELDQSQLVFERDFGYGQIVQWGDSLPRRFMLRLRNFVQSIVMTQRMLKPGYSGAGESSSDNVSSIHERCYKVFGSLYERLIQKPCTDGMEGIAVLCKLYMLFHPLSHPMLPCLEGALQSKRRSLRRAWRKEATNGQFFTCLANGLDTAATLLGGRSTEKGKARRRRMQQGQGIDDVILMKSVLLTYHKVESDGAHRKPATQKELGRLAGGEKTPWEQPRVSRALSRIFGSPPMKKYKSFLRGSAPLQGFVTRGESSEDPNDIEIPHYRPHHPTERDERRSQNT